MPLPLRLLRAATALVLALLGLAALLAALTLSTAPHVPEPPAPDPRAAALDAELAGNLGGLLGSGQMTVRAEAIGAALRSIAYLQPALRGDAAITEGRLDAAASLALPGGLWLNARVSVLPSTGGLALEGIRIGRLPLPPGLTLAAVRAAADRLAGPGTGEKALGAVGPVAIGPDTLSVALAGPRTNDGFFERLVAQLVHAAGAPSTAEIREALALLDAGFDDGSLPATGSFLPHLRLVAEQPMAERPAAIVALAIRCGNARLGRFVGIGRSEAADTRACDGVTLVGRDDLKRHFAISAALGTGLDARAAFGLGEIKELLDSNAGGSGFNFEDMAADMAGLRFTLALARDPGAAARIGVEGDVMPDISDLPHDLSATAFRARFGAIGDPAYQAEVARISARIDALRLHSGAAEIHDPAS